MTPAGWRVPQREELFPIAAEQSCAICGSQDWRYVYLLLNTPQWVQALPWVVNWFMALCGPCHAAYQSGDDVTLAAAYEQSDRSASSPDVTELLHVLRARSSEPPVSRDDAQHTP
jgi:hypothetical protein